MAFQKIYLPFHNAGTSFGCNTPILASIGTPEIPKQQSRGTGVAMLPSVGHPSTGQNRCRRGESARRLLPYWAARVGLPPETAPEPAQQRCRFNGSLIVCCHRPRVDERVSSGCSRCAGSTMHSTRWITIAAAPSSGFFGSLRLQR